MIQEPRDRLRNAFANAVKWQEITGTLGHPDKAAQHIYFDAIPEPAHGDTHSIEELTVIRPYIIIYYGTDGFVWQRTAMGETSENVCSEVTGGQMIAEMYRNTPQGMELDEVSVDFVNVMDHIVRDVLDARETSQGLFINRFTFDGPMLGMEEEQADQNFWQGALMTFDWGMTQAGV